MSNVIEFTSKEKQMNDEVVDSMLDEEVEEKRTFDPHNLEMIKRGIKSGLSMLDKAIETDQVANVSSSIQKTLINLNELVGLLEHDLVGMIKNMETQAAGQWTMQAHLQTLIETLKNNSVVTDQELEGTWNKIVVPMMEEMKDQA